MVGHHDKCVQLVSSKLALPIEQRTYYQVGDFRAAQMEWAARPAIQEPIHRHECLSRRGHTLRMEHTISRKTAMEAERDKKRLIDSVPVREPPFIVPHSHAGVCSGKNFLEKYGASRLKGGCGQDWPPHLWQLAERLIGLRIETE